MFKFIKGAIFGAIVGSTATVILSILFLGTRPNLVRALADEITDAILKFMGLEPTPRRRTGGYSKHQDYRHERFDRFAD